MLRLPLDLGQQSRAGAAALPRGVDGERADIPPIAVSSAKLTQAAQIKCARLPARARRRSHDCDWPAGVGDLPALNSTTLEKGLGSRAIDDRVQAIVAAGLSVYAVNAHQLRALRPDVILTQTQCAVCAVTPDDLTDALGAWTGGGPTLVSLAPDDLVDVWGHFDRVAEALGSADAAPPVIAGLKTLLDALAGRAPDHRLASPRSNGSTC